MKNIRFRAISGRDQNPKITSSGENKIISLKRSHEKFIKLMVFPALKLQDYKIG
jgi:hypothetical protein